MLGRHTLTVLSSEALSSIRPSFEKATLRTVDVCALSTVDLPSLHAECTNHIITKMANLSFGKGHTWTHTVGCHRRIVRSLDPLAMRAWVGEKATEYTPACTDRGDG
jgi:hypothetical protein